MTDNKSATLDSIKLPFVPPSQGHHPLQYPNTALYFLAWYGLTAVEQPLSSLYAGKSMTLLFCEVSAYHNRQDLNRYCLASLVCHFTRALEISSQLQTLKAGIDAHETAVNTLKVGIISINPNAKVLYANDLALNMLNQPGGLMIRQSLLCSATAQGNQELSLLLDLAKRGIGQTWTLARQPPNPSLTIKSLPLGMAEATTCMPKEMQAGKILLLLTEENSPLSNPYDHFGNLYRLTRQEIKVLQGLVAGYSTKEIADRHYVSYHTVRSQLASLLQKTGCHQQKDLLRLFFSGPRCDS